MNHVHVTAIKPGAARSHRPPSMDPAVATAEAWTRTAKAVAASLRVLGTAWWVLVWRALLSGDPFERRLVTMGARWDVAGALEVHGPPAGPTS